MNEDNINNINWDERLKEFNGCWRIPILLFVILFLTFLTIGLLGL